MRYFKYLIFIIAVLAASCNSNNSKIDDTHDDSSELASSDTKSMAKSKTDTSRNKKSIYSQIAITQSATIKTSMGDIEVALYGKDAPNAVENFVTLARRGFYNGILFHRVAKNFVIQAGDPATKHDKLRQDWGMGGESIFGSGFETELNPKSAVYKAGYARGTLAMANRGPGTNTSQFFICLADAAKLDKEWTIFGRVTKGMEVVEEISAVEVEPSPRGRSDGIPKKPIKIISIKPSREKESAK